ncbi:hypothetical protein OG242_17480 [Streptomyces sp. NBC_00727]|uniref:hypothetical protein n=1 Tax=Streptomyces sp. NBC_00727 TaxID=2903675 RepID=UPI0038665A02
MSALERIVSFIATGRIYGIGVGSTPSDMQRAVDFDFVDIVDEDGDSMRRDYGFIEFYLNLDQEWRVSGGSVELHRLAGRADMAERWSAKMQDRFPRYLTWDELRSAYSSLPGAPALRSIDQGDFQEYRATETKVSVLVSSDGEERDEWLGHGDVWSVSLG